jgi:hypothetical protein
MLTTIIVFGIGWIFGAASEHGKNYVQKKTEEKK